MVNYPVFSQSMISMAVGQSVLLLGNWWWSMWSRLAFCYEKDEGGDSFLLLVKPEGSCGVKRCPAMGLLYISIVWITPCFTQEGPADPSTLGVVGPQKRSVELGNTWNYWFWNWRLSSSRDSLEVFKWPVGPRDKGVSSATTSIQRPCAIILYTGIPFKIGSLIKILHISKSWPWIVLVH